MKIKSSKKNSFTVLGISAVIILLLIATQSFSKKKKEIIEVPKIVATTTLNTLQITLKEKHYKKIKKKRNNALADGILETDDNDYVPAILTFNGKDYKADIRLKGDWTDHLEGNKWSYRIKLKGDQTIFGMRKFSIHHPKTRGYVNEWLYHKANKDEGLIGLRYNFTEGFMHIKLKNKDSLITKNLGIYAIEETFDKRTIESNKRKEGVILRISEQYFWKEVKQAWKIEKQTGFNPRPSRSPKFTGPGNEYVSTFGLSKILEDENLSKQFVQAKNLLENYRSYKLTISEVFDVDKLALYTVLNNLFCGYHGMEAINMRIYYNPTTDKLEPIAYDANAGKKAPKFYHYFKTKNKIDAEYAGALITALEKVTATDYFDNLYVNYKKDISIYETILKNEFGQATIIKQENYIHNITILKQELERLKSVYPTLQ